MGVRRFALDAGPRFVTRYLSSYSTSDGSHNTGAAPVLTDRIREVSHERPRSGTDLTSGA